MHEKRLGVTDDGSPAWKEKTNRNNRTPYTLVRDITPTLLTWWNRQNKEIEKLERVEVEVEVEETDFYVTPPVWSGGNGNDTMEVVWGPSGKQQLMNLAWFNLAPEKERETEREWRRRKKERGSWNRKCLAADKSTAVLKVHHTAVRDRADIGWSYVSFCFLLILLILIRIAAPSLAARPIPKTIHYPTEEWLRRPPLAQTYKNISKISLCVLPGQSFSSSSANVQHRKKSERRQWQTWETAKEYNQHFLINIHPLFFFHFASLILHFPRIFNPTIAAI